MGPCFTLFTTGKNEEKNRTETGQVEHKAQKAKRYMLKKILNPTRLHFVQVKSLFFFLLYINILKKGLATCG